MLSVKQAEQQVAYEALTNANIFNAELAQSTVGLQGLSCLLLFFFQVSIKYNSRMCFGPI